MNCFLSVYQDGRAHPCLTEGADGTMRQKVRGVVESCLFSEASTCASFSPNVQVLTNLTKKTRNLIRREVLRGLPKRKRLDLVLCLASRS